MNKQNKEEAIKILEPIVEGYRHLSYADLLEWVKAKKVGTREVTGDSGTEYQIELEAYWDGKPDGAIRFSGSIYDDSASRFLKVKTPVSIDFLKEKS